MWQRFVTAKSNAAAGSRFLRVNSKANLDFPDNHVLDFTACILTPET
jgi:hypothetical protein